MWFKKCYDFYPNASLNLISNQPDMNKKYFYAKDPDDAKYKCLINKRKSAGL